MNQFINQQNTKHNFVIRRLVIYHQGFVCKDESAEMEELAEHILYYFDIKHHLSSYRTKFHYDDAHRHHDNMRDIWGITMNHDYESQTLDEKVLDNDNDNDNDNDDLKKAKKVEHMKSVIRNEAVQFVGMCETLQDFTLSISTYSSLTPEDSSDESDKSFMKQVNLSDSMLVYVPLEEQCYAVAEVPSRITFECHNPCRLCTKSDIKQNNQDLNRNDNLQPNLSNRQQQHKHQSNQNSFLGWKNFFSNKNQTNSTQISNVKQDGSYSQIHLKYNHHLLCTNQYQFDAAGGDPEWVYDSIKTCHLLFCMLSGKGGIIHRIGSGIDNSKKSEHDLRNNDETNTNHNENYTNTGDDDDNTINDNANNDYNNFVDQNVKNLKTSHSYIAQKNHHDPMNEIRLLRKKHRKAKQNLKSHLHNISMYEHEKNTPIEKSEELKNGDLCTSNLDLMQQKQDILNEIEELQNEIIKLLPSIPITSLRKDLQLHYDKILHNMLFPSPNISTSKLADKSNRHKSLLSLPNQLDLDMAGTLMIGRLMDELLLTFRHEGIIALSSFYQRKLAWTQDNIQTRSTIHDVFMSRKETVVLYEYMKNYQKPQTLQQQMKPLLKKKKKKLVSSASATKQKNTKHERINLSSHGPFSSSASQKTKILPFFMKENMGFYASLPTKIKNNDDKNLNSETEQQIWSLELHLCSNNDGERCNYILNQGCHSMEKIHSIKNYRVVCFSCFAFDFLLYFETQAYLSHKIDELRIIPSHIELNEVKKQHNIESSKNQAVSIDLTQDDLPVNEKHIPSNFLTKIADYLSIEIRKYDERMQRQCNSPKEQNLIQNINKLGGETGLEILYTDHSEQNVIIRSQKFNFHGNINQFQPLFWNDDSYPSFLASHLTDDVIMAFNDILIHIDTTHNCNSNDHISEMREICTLLHDMWIYGVSHDSQELVIMFDTKKFATIADVLKSAHRVRNEMFNQVFL